MKKTIIFFVILTATLGFMLYYAKPAANNDSAETPQVKGVLEADRNLHDFGTISMKDGNVKTAFKIKNPTTKDLALNRLYTSCMCTEATIKIGERVQGPFGMLGHGFTPTFSESLRASEEAEIEVEFDPNAHGPSGVGPIERVVTLEGEGGKLIDLNIKANVIP